MKSLSPFVGREKWYSFINFICTLQGVSLNVRTENRDSFLGPSPSIYGNGEIFAGAINYGGILMVVVMTVLK